MAKDYDFGVRGISLTCVESHDSLWQAVAGVVIRVFPYNLNNDCRVLVFQLVVGCTSNTKIFTGTVVASQYRIFKSRKALIAAWESMLSKPCFTAGTDSKPLDKPL